jgi:cytochrome b561
MNAHVPAHYGGVALIMHWATAALIVALFILGWRMIPLPLSPAKLELYALHKSLGIAVLALSGFRLAWRLARPAPKPVDGPIWQRRAATGAHMLLYALLLVLPLSGWLFNSLVGFPLSFFGMVDVPPLAAPQPAPKETVRLAHIWLGYMLLVALGLHVAAALHHHFVRRDEALVRMLPRLTKSTRRSA